MVSALMHNTHQNLALMAEEKAILPFSQLPIAVKNKIVQFQENRDILALSVTIEGEILSTDGVTYVYGDQLIDLSA